MKCQIISLLQLLLLINCKKQEFERFNFSYGNTFETDFSIQFNAENDSVFICEHWSANTLKDPLSKTNYVSKLNTIQKRKLDSFVQNINFETLDTLYFEDYQDGTHYSFYLKRNGNEKLVRVRSERAPKDLERFASWIYKTKKSLKLIKTVKHSEFKSKAHELNPPKYEEF